MQSFALPVSLVIALWTLTAAAIGLAIGAVVDVVLVNRIRRAAHARGWHLRHALVASLRGMPEIWGVLIGLATVRPTRLMPGRWMVWLERAWLVALVLSLTIFAVRLATAFIRSYLSSDESRTPSGTIFVNITRVAIWAVGLTFALGALGIQVGPLVATLGVSGIAISLGLQDTLANLFNGLQITLTRQIEPGQFVRLQTGEEGEVLDVNWRDTRLQTSTGDVVIVPNAVIGRSVMTNYSRGHEEHVHSVAFSVDPGADLDRVVQVGTAVAAETLKTSEFGDPEFEPTCRVTQVGPEAVTCTANLRVLSYRKRGIVADEFLRALHKRLAAEGAGSKA
ncbi:MAG: mechanosensitive ion channel family protein [Coriobacteriales bacterium]|nr:mechanosensitive ion channel family protein [Coriobacteriales bacterium]